MLEAVAGHELLARSYAEALSAGDGERLLEASAKYRDIGDLVAK